MFYTNVFRRGNYIYTQGFDKGLRFLDKSFYKPYLFLPKDSGSYKTLDNRTTDKIQFDSMSDAKDFTTRYEDVSNFEYFGLTNWTYLSIYDNFPKKIEYDDKLISIVSIDIETSLYDNNGVKKFPDMQLADHEITAITITKNNKSATFGCGDYTPEDKSQFYVKCENEQELLLNFIKVWKSSAWIPDIITGYNIQNFDIPYICNRLTRLFSKDIIKKLSPWNLIEERKSLQKDKEIIYYVPCGISILDYMLLYKKFIPTPRESYSLNFIASEELNEKKLDYSEYSDLEELYLNNYQKFIAYNIKDTILIDRLEDKLNLIKMVINMAYTYKCNYEDVLGTVKPWDMYIHHYLLDKGIVIPQFKKKPTERELVGGYCKDIIPGLYEWVVSYDLKSSYPHQIINYNISPETLLGRLDNTTTTEDIIKNRLENHKETIDKHNLSVAGNLCVYRKDKKGFMSEIMELMFAERAEYQKKLTEYEILKKSEKTNNYDKLIVEYDILQQSKKLSINSFYGMLGNEWCRWYSIDLAESITLSGQLTVKWAYHKINILLNQLANTENVDYICFGDTDSAGICLSQILKNTNIDLNDKLSTVKYIQEFCKNTLDPYLKDAFQELQVITNSAQQKIVMARENIADRSIWTGKKHYIMNVLNSKGIDYNPAKLKIVGIETVKSSTPSASRIALKESINIIMNKTQNDLLDYIKNTKIKFNTLPVEDIAFPRGINNIKKYTGSINLYTKGTPIHVRAALVFNSLLKKYKLNDIVPIGDGDKIKYVYLKLPNITQENVIGMPNFLPKEFDLHKNIDREKQFIKSYLEPLRSITDAINWNVEDIVTLDDFFEYGED